MLKKFFTRVMIAYSLSFIIHGHVHAEKKAVFIIGPPRCGSSCTAGLLEILGLPLGDSLVGTNMQHPMNPKGFFEDIETQSILDNMLAMMGTRALTPVLIEWDHHPQKTNFMHRIKNNLQKNFSMFSIFGIKNARLALFLPLYCEAAQELGYTPKIIIIKRHTEETCASWKKVWHRALTDNQIETSVNNYLKIIAFYAPQYDCLEVNFDDVIHDTRKIVTEFNNFLPELKSYESVENKIISFIDKNLKHHNAHPTQK